MRTFIFGAVVLALLSLNPIGCIGSFDYGEKEMKLAVEGRYKLTVDHKTLELVVKEARQPAQHASQGIVESADACGTRSFFNHANACKDLSEMDVEVAIGAATFPGVFRVVSPAGRIPAVTRRRYAICQFGA